MAHTHIARDDGSYRLIHKNSPYFARGVVGSHKIDLAASYGANSIRTREPAALDRAAELGMTALFHLPVKPERSGMDYSDRAAISAQFDQVMALVHQYRSHPAVMIWELGNELDHVRYGVDPNWAVHVAVNDLAKAIHKVDDRPVLTVCGTGNWKKVDSLVERCPHLDLIGINAYADLASAPGEFLVRGWDRPYLVTEWGVDGWWQTPRTSFGLPFEQNSSEKADVYASRYRDVILGDARRCLGSYVFLWRQHQERTHTWFGMFDENWRESEAIDVMRHAWTGQWPQHRAPRIGRVTIAGFGDRDSIDLNSGSVHRAAIRIEPRDTTPLSFTWEILPENKVFGYGGGGEKRPAATGTIHAPVNSSAIAFTAPAVPDNYRLFVYAHDAHNHFATANIPFRVVAG